ncbi:MAG: hypothetical protein ABSC22_09845 [Roseiarcus sp.]
MPLLLVEIFASGNPRTAAAGSGIAVFVQLVVSSLSTATCLFGAYQIMRGRPFTIGASLMVGLRRFGPVLGTSVLGGLLIMVGMLLFLVPGVIIACAIYVALPACVIERLGPANSLRRSRTLTKGYRWPIFGLSLIVFVVAWLLGFGVGFGAARVAPGTLAAPLAGLVAQVLVGAFASVLYAVVYNDLRIDKEGVDIEHLASVFD